MDLLGGMFSYRALRKLLGLKVMDEEELWAKKAIEALVTKLKKYNRSDYDELRKALRNPSQPSKCVTIPRSRDGRQQVSHKKSLPHVIYCRIWRWPDLQSHHELKAIESCLHPYSVKEPNQVHVCINPYHYRRIESPVLPPVLVPRVSEVNLGYNSSSYQQTLAMETGDGMLHGVSYPNSHVGLQSPHSPFNSAASTISSGAISPYQVNYMAESLPPAHSLYDNALAMRTAAPMETHPITNFCSVPYEEQPYWASISYHELNSPVGEMFHCRSPLIFVDGFTNPPGNHRNRFCLGQLSNVNRDPAIEDTRKLIGKGIRLSYVRGAVFVECLSDFAIFFHSRNCNKLFGFQDSTVIKIPPEGSFKIFDNKEFADILMRSANKGFDSVYGLTNMCTIQLSFVKGWGATYHRQNITSTPCWIEIHLHGALQWLDKVLTQMGSCNFPISSVS